MEIKLSVTASGPLLSGQAPAIVQSRLEQAVTEATLFLYTQVTARTPQGVYGAQGGLLGSIQTEVNGRGTAMVKGIVASAQKYAEVIEKGRRPGKGMPPKGSLVAWIAKKFGMDTEAAAKIEFVVRRKIGTKGFEGAHMFEKALTENSSRIQSIFERYGLAMAMELNRGQ